MSTLHHVALQISSCLVYVRQCMLDLAGGARLGLAFQPSRAAGQRPSIWHEATCLSVMFFWDLAQISRLS